MDARQFFDTTLAPELGLLEAQRQATVKNLLFGGAVALIVSLIVAAVAYGATHSSFALWIPLLLGAIIFGCLTPGMTRGYTRSFKENVMRKLVAFAGSDLQYFPERSISESEFKVSQLFLRDPDRYQGDDMVEGCVGATRLRFSEVHAEYKTETRDSKGHTQTHWHDIFHGLFFIGDFNKHFNGVTVIEPDVAQRMLGGLGQSLQSVGAKFSGRELARLDDPEFEREFVVTTTDQIEARYILSPSLMARLREFKTRTGREMRVSFVMSQICLAIAHNGPMFEPPLWKPITFETVETYLADLRLALGIVEELDLNTRIWSKQGP